MERAQERMRVSLTKNRNKIANADKLQRPEVLTHEWLWKLKLFATQPVPPRKTSKLRQRIWLGTYLLGPFLMILGVTIGDGTLNLVDVLLAIGMTVMLVPLIQMFTDHHSDWTASERVRDNRTELLTDDVPKHSLPCRSCHQAVTVGSEWRCGICKYENTESSPLLACANCQNEVRVLVCPRCQKAAYSFFEEGVTFCDTEVIAHERLTDSFCAEHRIAIMRGDGCKPIPSDLNPTEVEIEKRRAKLDSEKAINQMSREEFEEECQDFKLETERARLDNERKPPEGIKERILREVLSEDSKVNKEIEDTKQSLLDKYRSGDFILRSSFENEDHLEESIDIAAQRLNRV